jgi:hypothetical protein
MFNYKQIKAEILEEMASLIDQVISGKIDKAELYFVRPEDVNKYLETVGWIDNGEKDIDTNGWEWDFWINYDVNNNKYILSGDGYYYDHVTFARR